MKSTERRVVVEGPLEAVAGPFRAGLERAGYSPLTAVNQMRVLAQLSRWMAAESVSAAELDEEVLGEFVSARRERGYSHVVSRRGLETLVRVLREEGLVPEPIVAPVSELDAVVEDYAVFLARERGLSESTIRQRRATAARFLSGRVDVLAALSAADVASYVVTACAGRGVGTTKLELTALRSLLGFLHVSGRVGLDLSPAVLGAAGWRHTGLPKALEESELDVLLNSCDLSRPPGLRDHAVICALARLGLRRIELARLALDDIDWRAGEITVSGKGSRTECLPLPVDVGEAIAAYLVGERPELKGERAVFLRCRAPQGPLGAPAITAIVAAAAARSGLGRFGAHRLRHTAATRTLRAGADLAEVGELLRHRHLSTTAIYAKVDRERLRRLARPWPFGSRDVLGGMHRLAQPWPVVAR